MTHWLFRPSLQAWFAHHTHTATHTYSHTHIQPHTHTDTHTEIHRHTYRHRYRHTYRHTYTDWTNTCRHTDLAQHGDADEAPEGVGFSNGLLGWTQAAAAS